MNKLTLTATIMGLFFASCNTFNPESTAKEWDAIQIGDESVAPSAVSPFVGFEDGQIYGFTGCNHINGGIEINGAKFSAQNMAMTMKLCPNARFEQNFVQALNNAEQIKETDKGFDLLNKEGKTVASFAPRTLRVEDLNGQWNLISFKGKNMEQNSETPFLIFDTKENRLAGFTGCNRLTGTLDAKELRKCKIDFSSMGMTRKLCQNHVFEADFMKALNSTNTIRLFNNRLYIYGTSETLIFEKHN